MLGFRPGAIGSKVPDGSQISAFLVEDDGKISLVLDKTILRGLQHVGLLTIPFHLVRGLAVLREILDVVDHGLMPKPRVMTVQQKSWLSFSLRVCAQQWS